MKRSGKIGWIGIGWVGLHFFAALAPVFFAGLALVCAQVQPLHSRITDSTPQEPVDGVYRAGSGVSPPRPTYNPEPEFSEQARNVGYEGVCVLELVVDAEGMPRDIRVMHPAGMGLDDKAIESVRQWRFRPGLKSDTPVAVRINVEVNFHLYSKGDEKPKLFQKANAGDAKAQFEIAQMLLADPYMAKDDSKGFGYLEKAAKQGLPPAQFAMGEYFSSRKNDLVNAYVWYALAGKNRYKESGQRLKELAEKMTPEELAEARQRAESDHPF